MRLNLTIFIFHSSRVNFPLREREVTESKKSQRKKTVIIEHKLEVGLIKAKKTRRYENIFRLPRKHRRARRPDHFLTSHCTEDTVSWPFPVITIFLFSLQTSSGWMVTPCPTEHSTGEFRFGISSNWTVIFLSRNSTGLPE